MQAVNISREGECVPVSGAVKVQRIGILCKANKDSGRGAMTSAAPRVVGCLELDRFHVPPPTPTRQGGAEKRGRSPRRPYTLPFTALPDLPPTFLQLFESYGRGVTEAHGTLTPAVLVRAQPTVPYSLIVEMAKTLALQASNAGSILAIRSTVSRRTTCAR